MRGEAGTAPKRPFPRRSLGLGLFSGPSSLSLPSKTARGTTPHPTPPRAPRALIRKRQEYLPESRSAHSRVRPGEARLGPRGDRWRGRDITCQCPGSSRPGPGPSRDPPPTDRPLPLRRPPPRPGDGPPPGGAWILAPGLERPREEVQPRSKRSFHMKKEAVHRLSLSARGNRSPGPVVGLPLHLQPDSPLPLSFLCWPPLNQTVSSQPPCPLSGRSGLYDKINVKPKLSMEWNTIIRELTSGTSNLNHLKFYV